MKNALARLDRAKEQEQKLKEAFNEWVSSEAIQIIGERDPEFARYGYFVVMHKEPKENLALLAGELFNNLRAALDYVAFQIFLAASGDPDSKQAKSVAFPIVTDADRWQKTLRQNVPGVWEAAAERLQWCQPFVQFSPNTNALPALQGVGATDKHRDLVLYAMGVQGVGGIAPELKDGQSLIMMMPQPGPIVQLEQPGTLSLVYVRYAMEGEDEGKPLKIADEVLVPWSDIKELKPPPPPAVHFGFRANDGSDVSIDAVPSLISYVEQAIRLFDDLKPPPKESPVQETDEQKDAGNGEEGDQTNP
ncbi:hypothetical protein [Mycolicibacterium neoaurum]|uniref:hypothetical protein n=1 Tax=Mycolicibacterium neoaurum TaxID=1795 RepID=UPI001F4C9E13|nr:hypothetical protein [Mycolicibacterium neoaurum]